MDAYKEMDHHPSISPEGKVPLVKLQTLENGHTAATLHCVDCLMVIDRVTTVNPTAAERSLRRRQARRTIPLTHCTDCAEHIGGLDHLAVTEEAPSVAFAYSEAHEEFSEAEGYR